LLSVSRRNIAQDPFGILIVDGKTITFPDCPRFYGWRFSLFRLCVLYRYIPDYVNFFHTRTHSFLKLWKENIVDVVFKVLEGPGGSM